MNIREKALELAILEMVAGHGEEGGNNAGQWVKMYLNSLAEPPCNWCMAFGSWCTMKGCEELGEPMPFSYSLSARSTENEFESKGWLLGYDDEVQPGDVAFFWRLDPNGWAGHFAFVNIIEGARKIIYTVEGNRGTALAKVKALPYSFGPTPDGPFTRGHSMALTGISLDNITMGFLSYGRIP